MQSTLTFHGGAGTVSGANLLLGVGDMKILLDCGLLHGKGFSEKDSFAYDPRAMDALIISHAHADHIGKIPKLVKDGFSGPIYSTPATRDLAAIMLEDAQKVLALEALAAGREPLYTREDVSHALTLWKVVEYHTNFTLGSMTARFFDAGHILGSAMVQLERGGKRFVYTGDLGNSPAPLLPDTELLSGVDYLVMESVYGDRNHEERERRTEKLAHAIQKIATTQGTLLIPTFALERTQILLYEINKLVESGAVPSIPVYLDSPLGTRVTELFKAYTHLYNERVQEEIRRGDDIFSFPKFTIVTNPRESVALDNMPGPKVILSSSGMSVGGRVLGHEERLLKDPKTMILFVGYQAVGTLGRLIKEGSKTVRINDAYVRVRATVETIQGYSGHKDSAHLATFVEHTAPTLKAVYVALGEPRSSLFLAQRLRDTLGVTAHVPEAGESVTLEL